MTVSAHDVAAALRERIPNLQVKKLHKLLYYCQGHHLATFGQPLFAETISAWDMGPVVGQLWWLEKNGPAAANPAPLDVGALNTTAYVVSRYGALSGLDLEHLTHAEQPWQLANAQRAPGERTTILPEWMRDYFRSVAAEEAEENPLDSAAVAAWLEGANERRATNPRVDDLDELRARLISG
jgi:uncharacterized phage-associated protein